MKRALQSFKLINSKRQPPNLKSILTRARFIFPAEIERDNATKTKRCNNTQCGTCDLLTETSEVLFNNSSTPFQIKENMDCTAQDVIYVIQCSGCNKQYIGETGNLRDRVRVHQQQIFTPYLRNLYMSHNIAHCSVGKRMPFSITPILQLNCDDRIYREEVEKSLIKKFRPKLNRDRGNFHVKTKQISNL